MDHSLLRQNLLRSQLCFWSTLVVCILIAPASLGANAGISYFGHSRWTIAPFELGMFATVYFLLQALQTIRADLTLRFLYYCLVLIAAGAIGVAIAPAIGNGLLDTLHRIFGSTVFVAQLILAVWLIFRFKRDVVSWLLYALQFAGGIIAFIYLAPAQGFSIQGQILFQLAFSIILLRSLPNPKPS